MCVYIYIYIYIYIDNLHKWYFILESLVSTFTCPLPLASPASALISWSTSGGHMTVLNILEMWSEGLVNLE